MNGRFPILVTILAAATLFGGSTSGQIKPDLVIASLHSDPDTTGRAIGKVSVTVANVCRAEAAQSFVIVTFKESDRPGAKSIYFVGSRLKPLRGGESRTVEFDPIASGKEIATSSYIVAEVDPYKKVVEASEENNLRTLNPETQSARSQCR